MSPSHDKNKLGERFRAIRQRLGHSQSGFATLLGVTQGAISQIERGDTKPSFDILSRLLMETSCSEVCGLLAGENIDIKSISDTASLITPVIRPLMDNTACIPDDTTADEYYAVPLVEGKIAAGAGGFLWDQVQSLVWVYRPEIGSRRNLVAVKVGGDSMYPTVPDGAIVIVDMDRRDPRGDRRNIWAIRTDQEGALAVKRLQNFKGKPGYLILSDNFNAYPPEVAWTDEPSELVIGQVVWMWRSLA